jgi:hypothetical protein
LVTTGLADGWIGFVGHVSFAVLMLILLVGSAFIFLFGAILAWRAAVLQRSGIRVQGRVAEKLRSTAESEGPDTIVEFSDLQGNALRHKLIPSSSDDPPVGQLIDLIYNPSDPREISGASFRQLWMVPLVACTCGGGGLLSVLWVVGREFGIFPRN